MSILNIKNISIEQDEQLNNSLVSKQDRSEKNQNLGYVGVDENGYPEVTKGLVAKNGEGINWITVDVSSSDELINGANLLAAYSAARNLTPNGVALSSINRGAVLLPPGVYNLGANELVMDTNYIDLIGLASSPESTLITCTIPDGTSAAAVRQLAVNSIIQNLTMGTSSSLGNDTSTKAYAPSTSEFIYKLPVTVDIDTDTFSIQSIASGSIANLETGSPVFFTGTTAPTGLSLNKLYFCQKVSNNSFKITTIYNGSTVVNITANTEVDLKAHLIGVYIPVQPDDITSQFELSGHGFYTNDQIIFNCTTYPTGLAASTTYYIKVVDQDNFSISATPNGEALSFGSDGVGVRIAPATRLVSNGQPTVRNCVFAQLNNLTFKKIMGGIYYCGKYISCISKGHGFAYNDSSTSVITITSGASFVDCEARDGGGFGSGSSHRVIESGSIFKDCISASAGFGYGSPIAAGSILIVQGGAWTNCTGSAGSFGLCGSGGLLIINGTWDNCRIPQGSVATRVTGFCYGPDITILNGKWYKCSIAYNGQLHMAAFGVSNNRCHIYGGLWDSCISEGGPRTFGDATQLVVHNAKYTNCTSNGATAFAAPASASVFVGNVTYDNCYAQKGFAGGGSGPLIVSAADFYNCRSRDQANYRTHCGSVINCSIGSTIYPIGCYSYGPTSGSITGTLLIDPTADTFTLSGHGLGENYPIKFKGGTVPAGLSFNSGYFAVSTTTDTFKVSNFFSGNPIDITSSGSGVFIKSPYYFNCNLEGSTYFSGYRSAKILNCVNSEGQVFNYTG